MQQELTRKIRSNPKFAELTQKRTKFGVQLSILMLADLLRLHSDCCFRAFGAWNTNLRSHHPWDSGRRLHHRGGLRADRDLCPPRQFRV